MKTVGFECKEEKSLETRLLVKKGFLSKILSCPIRNRKLVYGFASRFELPFLVFEVFSIGLLAAKEYLHGDGLACTMEGLRNEQQARNSTYKQMLRSFCAIYSVPPDPSTISKNETFIRSLDYFIAAGKETYEIKRVWFRFMISCVVHLVGFLVTLKGQKRFGAKFFQPVQLYGMFAVLLSIERCMVTSSDRADPAAQSELIAAELSGTALDARKREPLLHLALDFFRRVWAPILWGLFIVNVVKTIEFFEKVGRDEFEPIVFKENKRWRSVFAKLEKLSDASGFGVDVKEPHKQTTENKRSSREPPIKVNSLLDTRLFEITIIVFIVEFMIFISLLVFREWFLGNRSDCIVEGVRTNWQATSGLYRELVRNSCGMFGVPPDYLHFYHENDFFYMRDDRNYYRQVSQANESTSSIVAHPNETFLAPTDQARIRQEEDLDRKRFVLVLLFLVFLQLFMIGKHPVSRPYPIHQYIIRQLIYQILFLLVLILCKSLMFGQIRLFSAERTVFRVELRHLPVLKPFLHSLKAENQTSFLTYLLNPPKFDYSRFWYTNRTLDKIVGESFVHYPHSDNKIYLGPYVWHLAYYIFDWYMTIWIPTVCLLIICIITRAVQVVYLLSYRTLIGYSDWLGFPSSESRWNSLIAKLDKMCEALDKKEKKESNSTVKLVAEDDRLVIEADKREKID